MMDATTSYNGPTSMTRATMPRLDTRGGSQALDLLKGLLNAERKAKTQVKDKPRGFAARGGFGARTSRPTGIVTESGPTSAPGPRPAAPRWTTAKPQLATKWDPYGTVLDWEKIAANPEQLALVKSLPEFNPLLYQGRGLGGARCRSMIRRR
jgi:hypothetical protein